MLTLYGQLQDAGDAWLFTPARRLDRLAPNFGQAVRLPKDAVEVGEGFGLRSVRLSTRVAREAGLIEPPNTRAAMCIA